MDSEDDFVRESLSSEHDYDDQEVHQDGPQPAVDFDDKQISSGYNRAPTYSVDDTRTLEINQIDDPTGFSSAGSESGLSITDVESPSRKRSSSAPPADLPFKRRKGQFKLFYVDMLNEDIADASNGVHLDDPFDLPDSQIGLVEWSGVEKRICLEAVARLGRDDIAGISKRLRTKSEAEISQFLMFMEASARARTDLVMADIPAAVELSQPLCVALEEVADGLSIRQDQHESVREREKWGDFWDITPTIAASLDRNEERRGDLAFAQLFRLSHWLALTRRVFMNADFPENNWQSIDENSPSMRATALEDFRALAVSITRRLVNVAGVFALQRIRDKESYSGDRTSHSVRREDVVAAVASLGLPRNSVRFWAECPRRIRLRVHDVEDLSDVQDSDEPMTLVEVENALMEDHLSIRKRKAAGISSRAPSPTRSPSRSEIDQNDETEDTEYEEDSDTEEDLSSTPSLTPPPSLNPHNPAIRLEAREILHSGIDIPRTQRTLEVIERRVAVAVAVENDADARDAQNSRVEEQRLWNALGLRDEDERGRAGRRRGKSVEGVVESVRDEEDAEGDAEGEESEWLGGELPGLRGLRRMRRDVTDLYSRSDWRDVVDYVEEWESRESKS